MTSICGIFSAQKNITPVPFCDRSFKTLRLLAHFVNQVVQSLFFEIASVCLSLFSKRIAKEFAFQSTRHLCLSEELPTYFKFGDHIVDFAQNRVTRAKQADGENEVDAIKRMYGVETVAPWLRIDGREVHLKLDQLQRREVSGAGCCFGMSLEFGANYLEAIRKGLSPSDAVKGIAPLFNQGAPDRAQLAQIFYQALDISPALEAAKENLKEAFDAVLRWSNEEREKLVALAGELDQAGVEARLAAIGDEARVRIQRSHDENKRKLEEIVLEKENLIAEKMGLKLEPAGNHPVEGQSVDLRLEELVSELPVGVYKMSINGGKEGGHAVLLIKTDDALYVHDSNYGTLHFDGASAKTYWQNLSESRAASKVNFVRLSSAL